MHKNFLHIKDYNIQILHSAYNLSHSINSLIFIKHFCMILLLNLDICKNLSDGCIGKIKHIRIILSRYKFFRANTVCC